MPKKKTSTTAIKTVKKKTATPKRKVSLENEMITSSMPEKSSMPFKSKSKIIILLVVLIIFVLLFLFRSLFIVAFVNGQAISRLQIIKELEKQGGKQILNQVVQKVLISQEANKKNIVIAQKDVDDRLKTLESQFKQQGQTIEQATGGSREDLAKDIKIQLQAEKLLEKNTKVSDKDVDDYIAKNKDSLPQGTDPKSLRTEIKQQLQSDKFKAALQTLLQDLFKKAKISYLLQY